MPLRALLRSGPEVATTARRSAPSTIVRDPTNIWGNAEWHYWKSMRSRSGSGGIVALDDLSFTIDEGQICGLIGPNGAGKTTMFNVVSRIYQPTSGSLRLDRRHNIAFLIPSHRTISPSHGIARSSRTSHSSPA